MDQRRDHFPQIVVAGHACLDVIPRLSALPRLEPGKLFNIGQADVSPGGAVSNVGLALRRLGMRTRLIAKIGDDLFGRELRRIYSSVDADLTQNLIIARDEATSYTLVMSPSGGDRCFLHCPGANDSFDIEDLNIDAVQGARIFHFGYPPAMRRMHDASRCAEIFARVRQVGVQTSLDMCGIDPNSDAGKVDWRQWLATVLPHVDYFVPSVDEMMFMLEYEAAGISAPLLHDVSTQLLDMGARCVLLKLGEQGLYLRQGELELHTQCFDVKVAGTTGAGDCTIAGFLAGVIHGQSLAQAIESATAVGACSCEAADATSAVPTWEAVMNRIAGGWKKRMAREEPT